VPWLWKHIAECPEHLSPRCGIEVTEFGDGDADACDDDDEARRSLVRNGVEA